MGKTNPIQSQSKPIKANLPDDQMNVTTFLTKDYENISNWTVDENKANTNPIRTQYEPNQTQSVVSLPALPALSLSKGAQSKGSNLFQRQKNAVIRPYCHKRTLASYRRIRTKLYSQMILYLIFNRIFHLIFLIH